MASRAEFNRDSSLLTDSFRTRNVLFALDDAIGKGNSKEHVHPSAQMDQVREGDNGVKHTYAGHANVDTDMDEVGDKDGGDKVYRMVHYEAAAVCTRNADQLLGDDARVDDVEHGG